MSWVVESWVALHHMHTVNHHGISTLSEMNKEARKPTFGRHLCIFLLLQAFALHHKIFTIGGREGYITSNLMRHKYHFKV